MLRGNITNRGGLVSIMRGLNPAIFTGIPEQDRRGAEQQALICDIQACLAPRVKWQWAQF